MPKNEIKQKNSEEKSYQVKDKRVMKSFARFLSLALMIAALLAAALFAVWKITEQGAISSLEEMSVKDTQTADSYFTAELNKTFEKPFENEDKFYSFKIKLDENYTASVDGNAWNAAALKNKTGFGIFQLSQLCSLLADKNYLAGVFSDGTSNYLFVKDFSTMLSAFPYINSDYTFAVISETGNVVWSDSNVFGSQLNEKIVGETAYKTELNGGAVIATSFKVFNIDSVDYYLLSARDYNSINLAVKSSVTNAAIVLGVVFALLMVVYILYSVVLFGKSAEINGENIAKKYHYFVRTDEYGDVKRSNLKFREDFGLTNIFKDAVSGLGSGDINVGDSFWTRLVDKGGKQHILCLTALKVGKSYAFTGNDEAELLTVKGELITESNAISGVDSAESVFEAAKNRGEVALVGLIEVVDYNNILAMFGSEFADRYFVSVCARIRRRLGSIFITQNQTVAVVVGGIKEVNAAMRDMREIVAEINRALKIDDNLLKVNAKAGFALSDGQMPKQTYDYANSCAAAALNRAKHDLVESFYIYQEAQKKAYKKYFQFGFDIAAMLKDGCFYMEYQPQLDLKTEKIIGFEALFRLKKSLMIDIDIFELITYAERTGKMILLGDFIFDTGMAFAKSIEGLGVTVSLNVSPVQFMQAGFVDNFLKLYKKHELKSGSVCVEITESFLVANFSEVLKKLTVLHDNGIKVHLDDFGMGYSSLLYLKKLPVDSIKIDREFAKDVNTDKFSHNIIKFISELASTNGLRSIVEGVETEEQKAELFKLGCDEIQGYLVGRSMTDEKARGLINEINK